MQRTTTFMCYRELSSIKTVTYLTSDKSSPGLTRRPKARRFSKLSSLKTFDIQ